MLGEIHLFVIPNWVHWLAACGVAAAALRYGGWAARLLGVVQLLIFVQARLTCSATLCAFAGATFPSRWHSLAVDALLFAVCLGCAWRTPRYWVLWASAFALLSVVTDVAWLFVPGVTFWAAVSANIIWWYGAALAVLWGVLGDRGTPRMAAA